MASRRKPSLPSSELLNEPKRERRNESGNRLWSILRRRDRSASQLLIFILWCIHLRARNSRSLKPANKRRKEVLKVSQSLKGRWGTFPIFGSQSKSANRFTIFPCSVIWRAISKTTRPPEECPARL